MGQMLGTRYCYDTCFKEGIGQCGRWTSHRQLQCLARMGVPWDDRWPSLGVLGAAPAPSPHPGSDLQSPLPAVWVRVCLSPASPFPVQRALLRWPHLELTAPRFMAQRSSSVREPLTCTWASTAPAFMSKRTSHVLLAPGKPVTVSHSDLPRSLP